MKRFPIILAGLLALVFVGLAALSWTRSPSGTRWLGDGIHNSSDVAVYLSYLRQGADGRVFLSDLFAVEPHRTRVDAMWSTLGLAARMLDPVAVHEIARILFIIALVFSLWAAARSRWDDADARLAVLLSIGGVGTGWIYSVWLGARGLWTPTTYAAPDIVTEFAIGPVLFGGAHMILSIALLLTCLRLLWSGIETGRWRATLLGGLSGAALLSFHPYFAPLIATVGLLAVMKQERRLLHLLAAVGIMLPPVAYYAWLLTDPVFGAHHLVGNVLPLNAPVIWLLTLAPFLAAFVWMWLAGRLPKKLDWASAWILAAALLLLFLPVPWKRKLTEGLIVPLVFLTMPAWIAIRNWVRTQRPRAMRTLLACLLILAAWLGPVHLLLSQIAWIQKTDAQHVFYQPTGLFEIAERLRREPGDAVVLSDDRWVNVWLPALTGKRVWIGHDHETPDFDAKRILYHKFLETSDPMTAQRVLRDAGVTRFITTSDESTDRFRPLLGSAWMIAGRRDEITVWTPRAP